LKKTKKTADGGFYYGKNPQNTLNIGTPGHGEGFDITKCADCGGYVSLKGEDRWRYRNDPDFKPLCVKCGGVQDSGMAKAAKRELSEVLENAVKKGENLLVIDPKEDYISKESEQFVKYPKT